MTSGGSNSSEGSVRGATGERGPSRGERDEHPGNASSGAAPVGVVIRPHLGLAALSGLFSLLAGGFSLRLTRGSVAIPWGGDDGVTMYMAARTMLSFGWFTWNPNAGFPHGMDSSYWPSPELHQWLMLKMVLAVVDQPIAAVNIFFLLGFFIVGFCSFLLFGTTVRWPWLAVALSVTAATVPWHYSRFPHTLLADYSPVPMFLLLAFLMWNQWWASSNRRLLIALAASLYVGSGGVYYSFFACLVLGPVLIGRIWHSRRFTAWWRDAAVVLAIPITLLACLVAHRSLAVQAPAGTTYLRDPIESLAFAGDARSLFTPWPIWDMVRMEQSAHYSVLASLAMVLSVAGVVAFALLAGRRTDTAGRSVLESEIRPWFRLLVWVLIWAVPGMGWVFASLVSPSIRSWGRLSIVLVFISLIIAGILARWFADRRPRARVWLLAGVVAVLLAQISLDHRVLLDPGGPEVDQQAREYSRQVSGLLEPGCPVLQLPVMHFPEDWRADIDMSAYDHLWMAVYLPDYRWSFAAVDGTAAALAARARYPEDAPMGEIVSRAHQDGFCAVHVDLDGLTPEQLADLDESLGQAEASVGRWQLQLLSGDDLPAVNG